VNPALSLVLLGLPHLAYRAEFAVGRLAYAERMRFVALAMLIAGVFGAAALALTANGSTTPSAGRSAATSPSSNRRN
jgi:hypothetical protein